MAEKTPPKPDFMTEEAWKALTASRDPELTRAVGKAHAERYLATNGHGEDNTAGGPTLLLTTVGRKSGNEVIAPVNFMQDGDNVWVVGSLAGMRPHPFWALNLEVSLSAEVQQYDEKWNAEARLVSCEERAKIFVRLSEHFPLWGHFQKYSDREFKVFELSPAD